MITGFSSPASGYECKPIDLNTLLIRHPNATKLLNISSTKYTNMGIYAGDILVVDSAERIKKDSLVVYEEDGSYTINRVYNIHHETTIQGVIIHIIHTVKTSE